MADLQIPLTLEDLEKPTPHRMIGVFESFTDILMGVSRDQFAQPNFAAMEILEHPDLHQESITLMSFYRQLSKLVMEVGVVDFSIRDLIKPEPGRMRRILSGIINFAKFREERLAVFEDCTAKSAEYVEKKHILEDKNRELAEIVNTLRLQRAEEEPENLKLREQNQQLTAELRELKRTQTSMTSVIDGLKKTKAEKSDKLTNIQFLLMNCKQDCTRLRSRIVQSPEKLQQAISDMTQSVQSEKTSLSNIERRIRDLQSKLDLMQNVDQDVIVCSKLLEDCELEMKKASSAASKVSTEKENIESKAAELREIGIKEQHIKRQLQNIEDKIARLQSQQITRRSTNDNRMKQLKEEYENVMRERETNQKKVDLFNSKVVELEAKTVELRKKMDLEAQSLKEDFRKLKKKADSFRVTLSKAISLNQR